MKTNRLSLTLKSVLIALTLLLTLLGTQAQAITYTYNYDAAGRLTNVDYTGGTSIAYTYDNNGNLLKRLAQGKAPQHTVTVIKNGTGTGTVTSNPAGINCGADCTEDYNENTVVTLTAVASAGSQFTGWTGAGCAGTGTCVFTLGADTQVTATFNLLAAVVQHTLSVVLDPANGGSVLGTGINCPADCTETLNTGTVVSMNAAPKAGFTFTGWSGGGCAGTGSCDLTLNSNTTVTAAFAAIQHTLTVDIIPNTPNNGGTVTGTGINCGADCTEDYNENTQVALIATPAVGFLFNGWTGDINGNTNPDNIIMSSDKNVTGNFALDVPDEDVDGITSGEEKGADGTDLNFDGNADGIADFRESETASFNTAVGNAYVTLSVPSGQKLVNVQALAPPSPGDLPTTRALPIGAFSFDITGVSSGACTVAELLIPLNRDIIQYFKFGPEFGNLQDHWYEFNFDATTGTGAVITHGITQTRIQLNLCDGKRGDGDLLANSVIKDPGAPAIAVAGGGGGGGNNNETRSIPALSPVALVLLMLLLIILTNRKKYLRP